MPIARLHGGPLDGQVIPLDEEAIAEETYIAAYGEGQIVYRRVGELTNTGEGDGPTEATFRYLEATEDINPNPDGRDD